MKSRLVCLLIAASCFAQNHLKAAAPAADGASKALALDGAGPGWPEYGGPNRSFVVPDAGLADTWPNAGPKVVWKRELGDGYAGVSEHAGKLFTMFRRDPHHEIVIALDAANGKTVWQYEFDSGLTGDKDLQYGPGPHVEPVVTGGRVFAIGITGKMSCLDEKTGRMVWSHDLVTDFGAEKMDRGYGNNPLPYKDTLLLPIGGAGHSIIALSQADGKLVWKNTDNFKNAYSSPILIRVNGEEQAVFFMSDEILGLNPATGALLWKHKHSTEWGLNISMPIWVGGHLLFMSSAYNGGSRVLELTRETNTVVTEKWFSNKLRIHITNAIPRNGFVIGSSGDFGPAFLTAVDINTGKELWRDRSFARANMILAGDKLILLDEDGHLALAKPDTTALHVASRADLLHHNAWTAPTLVGTRLYLRDRLQIMALELK
jgi:outer membrane protein assembly factor BamB